MAAAPSSVVDLVVVTNAEGRYEGVVDIRTLLAAGDETPMAAIVDRIWPRVHPDTDQEVAVDAAVAFGASAIPVVGADQRPVGVIPPSALLSVLAHEHREDVHRLVGIVRDRAGALHALEDPPLQRAGRRLPWLLVGLLMSVAATAVMAGFERALEANVAIVFFVPALVYLTDAIGTQTEAIAVRGLSLRKKPLTSILAREILTGGIIGLVLGGIAFPAVWLAFSDPILGIAVGVSLFAAGTLASAIGLTLPWTLSQLGVDPALGSGPVATIVQDVLTIVIYFLVVTWLLAVPW
jgi:magnesium transporter